MRRQLANDGAIGALGLVRLLGGFFTNITTLGPAVFAAVVALVLITAALASLIPALRASRLDPIATLRAD